MLLYVNRYKWVVDWIFVIVRAIPLYTTFYIVSIYLMLLFIGSILVKIAEDAEFQYTSCYSLSSSASCFSFLLPGFNTSHVTLYRCKGPRKCPGSLVSIHLMLLFIYSRWSLMRTKWRFNTSHVTLYLTAHEPDYPILKFQYISCYSLSLARI